jgi:hypothetical protein
VRLNGKDIESMPIRPSSGRAEASEKFYLPTGGLQAYINTLTIDFYFSTRTPPADVRPSFAIRQDSSLDLRGLPHSVMLPRLELFADAGYPFTEWPDGGRTAAIMPDAPSPVEIETLLDMSGFFGAQTGSLMTGLEVGTAGDLTRLAGKDLVLIGTSASQPLLSQWASAMPLDLSSTEAAVHQAPESALLLHPAWPFRENDGSRLNSVLNGGLERIGLFLEGFVSPLHPDRTVVAIVPQGTGAADAVRALFTPSEREGPVYGGVALSQNGRFQSFLAGTAAYHAGAFDRYQFAIVLLFENYRVLPLFVLLLSCLIAAWVRLSTERVAARRLAAWVIHRG